MTGRRIKRFLVGSAAIASSAMVAAVLPVVSHVQSAGAQQGLADEGVVCTANSNPATHEGTFLLTAKTGFITAADNNAFYMWGYSNGNGEFQHPGPIFCVETGDHVTITLKNTLPVGTSLQFPGMKDVKANGAPSDPVFDGTDGHLVSLAPEAAANGGAITYSFTASDAGSFLYESGSDPGFQVQMGLFGAIIVHPHVAPADQATLANFVTTHLAGGDASTTAAALADDPALAYGDMANIDLNAVYSRNHEYLMLLSELDPDLHAAVEQGTVDSSDDWAHPYRAHYFLINGRTFPDNISPNGAAWLPSQPFGAMAHVLPYEVKTDATHDAAANPLPALIHYLSVGVESYPMHPHSNHEKVIIQDGTPMKDGAVDLSAEHFAAVINPGATADATFIWTNVEDYSDTTGSRVPVPVPNGLNLTEGEYWNGTPYLGTQFQLNPGINGVNECGEYYHVVHSHNLPQATNYGATFGGMLSLIRVDPARHANGTPRCEN
jgi:Multicopper oxidase